MQKAKEVLTDDGVISKDTRDSWKWFILAKSIVNISMNISKKSLRRWGEGREFFIEFESLNVEKIAIRKLHSAAVMVKNDAGKNQQWLLK